MPVTIYRDSDANLSHLKGRTIAVLGYGAQGRAQALCLRDSGLDVVVGLRKGRSWDAAVADGITPRPTAEAAAAGDIVHVLLPDELQRGVYARDIAPTLAPGKTLAFSHGFNLVFGFIAPPAGVDVVLIAPKAPGTEQRKRFMAGGGVPGLMAIHHDATGRARQTALAMARGLGLTRAGVLECSVRDEAFEDLFGEQAVICGGVAELIKAGFETLVDAGYPPEMAYFECLHEMKLIVDLMFEGGLARMWDVVSNTAEYGGRTIGPTIIDDGVRARMKQVLARVEDGSFARKWIAEHEAGMPELRRLRDAEKTHPIEVVGARIRAMFDKA
jgi:ketol-acid reductoisomerase